MAESRLFISSLELETMSTEKTLEIIRNLFAKISSGQSPESIPESFCPNVDWSIPGAPDIAPWVGEREGRQAVSD